MTFTGTKAQNPMARFILLLAVVTLCGCGPSSDSDPKQSAVVTIASDAAPEPSAFRWDKEMNVIWLDTRIRPTQSRRFDIGLGSITIETLAVTENQLTLRYTPEIEGGYTVYECTVPISPVPVKFTIASDGTPGPTSFDLATCKVIRQGNVHFDSNPANKAVNRSGGSGGF